MTDRTTPSTDQQDEDDPPLLNRAFEDHVGMTSTGSFTPTDATAEVAKSNTRRKGRKSS